MFEVGKESMNELALFAGTGGGILGGILHGFRPFCAVEIKPYRREVLLRRQRDRVFPLFPIWDDIRTFEGKRCRGKVDVVTGGFPCQDISCAGQGAGIEGEKSGLWVEMARVIREVRPPFAFVENSPMLTTRGLGRILGDLAEMGFDARWGIVSAADIGAPHLRERIWILANAKSFGRRQDELLPGQGREEVAHLDWDGEAESVRNDSDSLSLRHRIKKAPLFPGGNGIERCGWWSTQPGIRGVAHGISNRIHRITALGDAQVPGVAEKAWSLLINAK